jgi:hypothetical protein
MTMIRRALIFVLALALVAPSAAFAGSRESILRDCQDGHMDGHYTQKQYADALAHMPTDVDEYTDCRDVIRRAQLGSASHHGNGGGGSQGGGTSGGATSGGATPRAVVRNPTKKPSHRERAQLEATRKQGTKPVAVAGTVVRPSSLGYESSSSVSTIPTPLLIALILLGIATLGAGGVWLRSRVIARRTR